MSDEWSVTFRTDIGTFVKNRDAIIKAVAQEATRTYLGYVLCEDCGEPVVDSVAQITGGKCVDCSRRSFEPKAREIEVMLDGARSTVNLDSRKKRYGSRGNPQTRRKVEAAKRRALRRLRWMHQLDYVSLLAEERAKVGLDPLPLETAVKTIVDSTAYDPANGTGDSHAARPPTEP
jgi:hypothetical protein